MSSQVRANVTPVDPHHDESGVQARVVASAIKLFAQQGYQATSVQQIVEDAGVTKGAMYHYFSSKDELLVSSYSQLLGLQSAHLTEIIARPEPAVARLRMASEDLVMTTLTHLDSAIVFHRSLHLLSKPSRQVFREQRRVYRELFEGLIREGMAVGDLRPDIQVDLAMYSFFGAVGYLTLWYTPGGPRSAEEVAAGYADLMLAALA